MSDAPVTLLIAQVQGVGAAYKLVANGCVVQVDPNGKEGMGGGEAQSLRARG